MTWLKIGSAEIEKRVNGDGINAPVGQKASRKSRSKSEGKRQEILNVARDQFLKNGFTGTSIDSIVEIVGGSKSTIYSHFGNKEALFAAVVRASGHTPETKDFPVTNGNIRDELIAFAKDRAERALSSNNIAMMRIVIAEAARQPELAELFFRNAPEPTYSALRNYLVQATNRGDLSIKDPRQASEQFLGELLQWRLLSALLGMPETLPTKNIDAKIVTLVDTFIASNGPSRL